MIFAWGNDAKVFFYNTNVLTVLLRYNELL